MIPILIYNSNAFVKDFVDIKVREWKAELQELAKIAITEPQCAYFGFITSLSKKWLYLSRTTPKIAEYLQPLEKAISEIFIPALVGRNITPLERQIFSLPVRFGGMGILDPQKMADFEYMSSLDITTLLRIAIINQETDFNNVDLSYAKSAKKTPNKLFLNNSYMK